MDTFPENLELIEFFDAEPVLSDPDLPWAYNRLSFSTTVGNERVDCIIDDPGIEVQWFRDEMESAFIAFYPVQDLSVQHYPEGKALVARGVGPEEDLTFRLQLRPRVHLALRSSR